VGGSLFNRRLSGGGAFFHMANGGNKKVGPKKDVGYHATRGGKRRKKKKILFKWRYTAHCPGRQKKDEAPAEGGKKSCASFKMLKALSEPREVDTLIINFWGKG